MKCGCRLSRLQSSVAASRDPWREGADARRGRVWLTPSSFSRLHRSDDVRVVVLLLHHRGRRRHHHMAGKIAGGARTALAPACSPSSGVQPAARSGWTANEKLARGGRYFNYRPPLGPCCTLDRARATQMRRGLWSATRFRPSSGRQARELEAALLGPRRPSTTHPGGLAGSSSLSSNGGRLRTPPCTVPSACRGRRLRQAPLLNAGMNSVPSLAPCLLPVAMAAGCLHAVTGGGGSGRKGRWSSGRRGAPA